MRGGIELIKIKNIFNTADLFTKHLERTMMDSCVAGMGHKFEGGRNIDAPELNSLVTMALNATMEAMVGDSEECEPCCSTSMMKSMIMNSIQGFDNGQNQQFMGCIDLLRELAENMAASEEEIGSTIATKRVADP